MPRTGFPLFSFFLSSQDPLQIPLQENSPAISASYTLSRFYNTSVTVFPFSPKFKPGCVAKKTQPCSLVNNTYAVFPRVHCFSSPNIPDKHALRSASRLKTSADDRSHEIYNIRNLQKTPLSGAYYDNYPQS